MVNPMQASISVPFNHHGNHEKHSVSCSYDTDEDTRVPPNCRFEIDDFEQPWSYSQPFDFIHGRELEGAIRDHDTLFQQAFQFLNPNGWLEMSTIEVNTYSDDNTHLKATNLLESVAQLHAGSKMFGKDMTSVVTWKEKMETAGFINVKEEIIKVMAPKSFTTIPY